MTSFCRFRWFPFVAKEPYAVVVSMGRKMVDDISAREKTAYPILMAGGISPDEKGMFLMVHTEGVHLPVLFNRHGEQLPAKNNTDEGIVENGIFVMGQLGRLLDDYRERGIFDESLIIVLGDHGRHQWGEDPGRMAGLFPCNGRPCLWVKPPRCSHPFAASGAPTTHARISFLLGEALKRDLDDRDIETILSSEDRIFRHQNYSNWNDYHVAPDNSWRVETVAPNEVETSRMRPIQVGQYIPLKFGIAEMRERGDIRFRGFPPQPGGGFLLGWRPTWVPGQKQVSIDFKVPSRTQTYCVRLVGSAWGGPPRGGIRLSVRGNDIEARDACEPGLVEVVLEGVVPDEDGIIEVVGERVDRCNSALMFKQLEVTETQGR